MTDMTPSRLGLVNGTGGDDAMFLKMFAGEVLTAFDEVNIMATRHLIRTITAGKSAQFPASWKLAARYHKPGEFIVGQKMNHAERIITIDDLLISDVFIASIDEAKNHYDVRSIYTKQAGAALAREMDRSVLQTAILAARDSATVTGAPGGSVIQAGATVATDPDVLVQATFTAAQIMDENDVPDDESRFLAIRPAQYYSLIQSDKLINRDFNSGNGDFSQGRVLKSAGYEVVKSNNLPKVNIAAPTGTSASDDEDAVDVKYGPRPLAKYSGDFTDTVGLIMHPTAVGTVKLMDLATEGEWVMSRQGTLLLAKYAMGHGILRPECAVEISKAVAT